MGFLETVLQIIPLVWLWDFVSQHVGYIKDLNDNVDTLMSESNELKRKRDDFEEDVKVAESIGKKRLRRVEDWFKDVDKIVPEVDSIKLEFDEGTMNPYSQHKLGKRVVDKIEVVKKLKNEGVFDEVAKVPRQSLVQKMEVPAQLEQQSTSQKTLEKIEQALSDKEVGIVCVYGMGGAGKTTLMKKIYNRFVETGDFHVVIWVTVSKDLNLQVIQQKIGNKLHMTFRKNEGIEEKRGRLYARLRNLRYMLILDDLWKAFSLDEAGIPKPDKQNRCKVVITSRSIAVSSAMEGKSEIKVMGLTSEEAWDLFCSKTGNVVLLREIQPIAEEVVKECGGLPLAIATVGGAMRGKDSKELWLNTLRALRRPALPEVPGMEQQVFVPLKLSYDYLEDPKIQLCFLYCSLFPEDSQIDICELVRYWICEGLVDNVDGLEEALNKGHGILDRLKDACLLETASKYAVKMHDLLRDLAIWITSPSSIQAAKFLVKSGEGCAFPSETKDWEGVGRISLMDSGITKLQIVPNCPDLVSFLLCKNWKLRTIHSYFFQLMPQLRILDLSWTAIWSLPPSLSHLVNLRALILTSCKTLKKMPPLGELKELQLLDLSFTGIQELPEGISNLIKLRQLDMSHSRALKRIPSNLISVLTCLEYLGLGGAEEMQVATWREVTTLPRLVYLEICVPDLNGFAAHDIGLLRSFSNLKRFRVCLGAKDQYSRGDGIRIFSDSPRAENRLTIHGCSNFPEGIEGLMSHVEWLVLVRCIPVCLSQIIDYSETLKKFYVDDCEGVRCIIDWREVKETNALDRLKELDLSHLPNLESIFDGGPPLPSTRFQRLQRVTIERCPKLRCLFSSSMVGHLHELEHLKVEDCEVVEEIVQGDILSDNVLQRLSSLHLSSLPKLTSICRQLPVLKSLEQIHVHDCPELKKLPPLCSDMDIMIRGPREWWEGLEWEDEHSKVIYSAFYVEKKRGDDQDALEWDQSFRGQRGVVNFSLVLSLIYSFGPSQKVGLNGVIISPWPTQDLNKKWSIQGKYDEMELVIKDAVRRDDEPIHATPPLSRSLLPEGEEDEPVHAIQPPLLSLFPGRGEEESVHAIEPLSMSLMPGTGEDESVHAIQPLSLSFLPARREDELIHAPEPPSLSLFPGRGTDKLVHVMEPLSSSLSSGRGMDESVHAIETVSLAISPGTGTDEPVHAIGPLSLSLSPGRGEDESVNAVQPLPLSLLPGGGDDDLVHTIEPLSQRMSLGRGEHGSVHAIQPLSLSLSIFLGRGDDGLVYTSQPLSLSLSLPWERRQ